MLRSFFSNTPSPNIADDDAKNYGTLLANHLLRLLEGCGTLNIGGLHSAAVALLRPLEDAFDCFAAVVNIEGAATKWAKGELRPSDAAKLWTPDLRVMTMAGRDTELSVADYRKHFRSAFAKYSHCSYALCSWDLFFKPSRPNSKTGGMEGTVQINTKALVIDRNGHSIDAHLTAHLLEFEQQGRRGYSKALTETCDVGRLSELESEIIAIMEKHNKHGCQDVHIPPELRQLKA